MSARLDTFELAMDDLQTLHELLQPVASEWYNLGVHMGIPKHQLDAIKADHFYEGVKTCLREVLVIWLKGLGRQAPSWPSLVAVLRKESIGEHRLAAKLEEEHCPQPQVPQVQPVCASASPVALVEDMCKYFQIPLDQICTTEIFLEMKRFFDWQAVSPHLGIDVSDIAQESCSEEEKRWKVLQRWRETAAKEATYRTLVRAVLKAGETDQVSKLLNEIYRMSHKSDSEMDGKLLHFQHYFEINVESIGSPSYQTALEYQMPDEDRVDHTVVDEVLQMMVKTRDDPTSLQDVKTMPEDDDATSSDLVPKVLIPTDASIPQNATPHEERYSAEIQRGSETWNDDPSAAGRCLLVPMCETHTFKNHDNIIGPVGAATSSHGEIVSELPSLNIHSHLEQESVPEKESTTPRDLLMSYSRTIRRNRLRDFRDCSSSCGESTAVCCASCLEVGRMCCSHCRENGVDCRSSEDSSRIKCISYKDCWRKHPKSCYIGSFIMVIISILLGLLLVLVSIFASNDPMSGAISTRPNDTALVRNEGFDPSQPAGVEIAKVVTSDPHVVNFYLELCNELTSLRLAIETGSYLEIVEQNTIISSYYLLVDSELTFVLTLNETVDQRHSEIIIFDSVVNHFTFIQSNITNSPLHIFPLSNGSTNFTLTASSSSYYFIDLFTPLSAGPTSIQYQVNGTIFYYDPTDLQKMCAIIPGRNISCPISLRPDTGSQYCILTKVKPLNTDNENTFVNNTYTSVPPRFNDSQLSLIIIGCLFYTFGIFFVCGICILIFVNLLFCCL